MREMRLFYYSEIDSISFFFFLLISLWATFGEGNGNPLQCSCLENPGTEKPGGQPSMGSRRVRHD